MKHRKTYPSLLLFLLCFAFITVACFGGSSTAPSPQTSAQQETPAIAADASATPGTPPSPTTSATSEAHDSSATVAALPAAFSGEEAFRHVEQLAGVIGSRPAGSDKEKQAADYIEAQFDLQAYRVSQQPFEFEAYELRDASLEVAGPSQQDIAADGLYRSPNGQVSGPLAVAGIGRPEDFPTAGLKDGIALIERGTLRVGQKVANAADTGAAGVVIYNNEPGPFQGNLGRGADIPAVSISREDGQRLKELLEQGSVEVRLNVDASQELIESQNVVANAGESCRIVVGGHYDSVAEGPGANDNASGTAAVIELARVLRAQAASQELCFIAFGGEELGLWGSRRYVQGLTEDETSHMVAMLNLDMVGVGDRWRLFGSEDLSAIAMEAAQAADAPVQAFTAQSRRGGSDHSSFIRAGIPAVFIHLMNDPNYHTPEDKEEFVDAGALEVAGKVAVGMIARLSATSQ